jgi:hypothetical protein
LTDNYALSVRSLDLTSADLRDLSPVPVEWIS